MKIKNLNQTPDGKYTLGDDIYFPTRLYLSHGEDDFMGGLCEIVGIEEQERNIFIYTKEIPGRGLNYTFLLEEQDELEKEFGKQRGYPDPDNHPDSNCWATPGDMVDGKKIDHYIP